MAAPGPPRPPRWAAARATPLAEQPTLQGRIDADVCILGAGYTGLNAALELAEAGYRVVVLEAERIAATRGRSLLNLDTATVDGAALFYEKLGYSAAGTIPDYALTPFGVMSGTILYFKRLSVP